MGVRRVGTGMAAVCAVTALLVSGCGGGGGGGGSASHDRFVYGDPMEPSSLNPLLQSQTDSVTEMVFKGLVGHGDGNKVVPALASSWSISKDQLDYTFHLRKNLRWQDGEPLTAADVAFTLDKVRDPAVNSPSAPQFAAVRSVATPDDTTVVVHLSRPYAGMLDALSLGVVPRHLLAGKDIARDAAFNDKPVGEGPYEITARRKGDSVTLRASTHWYGDHAPHIGRIVVRFVPDASQRLVQLRNGELDGAFLEPDDVATARKMPGHTVLREQNADFRSLVYNLRMPLLKDARVRQALDAAVDRDALVDSVLHGYGAPAHGPLDRSPFADKQLPASPHADPAEVDRLMTAAGWTKQHGTWTKDGKPAAFTLGTFTDDPVRADINEILVDQFAEAGFKATTEARDFGYVVSHWEEQQVFQTGAAAQYDPDPAVFAPFHCGKAGTANHGAYCDPAVDKDLDAGRASTDQDTRRRAYDDLQSRFRADPPETWLVNLDTVYAMPSGLKGVQHKLLGHHGAGLFENAQDWTWNGK
ncbi:ABC transporter substrate-binding protein [Streptomyces sp. NPDC047002]|uniref:ABC transporter substrate-binding protein n=1 Tax=Streptomyces sp. NPDC047002 TaxID=3155475 RepID=UPI003454EC35